MAIPRLIAGVLAIRRVEEHILLAPTLPALRSPGREDVLPTTVVQMTQTMAAMTTLTTTTTIGNTRTWMGYEEPSSGEDGVRDRELSPSRCRRHHASAALPQGRE